VPELGATFAALADPTRRAMLALLSKRPLRSGEIAQALAATRPTTSRHLRVLRRAGLVDEQVTEDDARGRRYTLRHERFVELRQWLDAVEAFWSEQLQAFKAHAEAGRRRR
jgi:DNA-binding transcriptional ArsR family regulator